MLTIWKWQLKPTDLQSVDMPAGAELLTVAEQHGFIAIWARCDPGQPVQPRHLAICGTGHPAPDLDSAKYVGTALLHDGNLVLHVFERVT